MALVLDQNKIYKYCNRGLLELQDVNVNLSIYNETLVNQYDVGYITVYEYNRKFIVTLGQTLTEPLTLAIKYNTYEFKDVYDSYTKTITIPAGQTEWSETILTKRNHYDTNTRRDLIGFEIETATLQNQTVFPKNCASSCTVAFGSVTASPTSMRGLSDGSITATITGKTSTNVRWYLDGVLEETSNTTSKTFSNLRAGLYSIQVHDGSCIITEFISVIDGEYRSRDYTINDVTGVKAAHNPIIYNVNTYQNSTQNIPAKSLLTLFHNNVPDNVSIEFILTSPIEYRVKFYAKGFPNKKNYFLAGVVYDEYGNTIGTNSDKEIMQSLYEVLSNDPIISNNYYISYAWTDRDIILTAKQTGRKFTLDENNVIIRDSSGNVSEDYFLLNVMDVGVDKYDGEVVDDLSVYAEVLINNNVRYPLEAELEDYIKVSDMVIPFQHDNQHRFDISPIVKNYVSSFRPNYDNNDFTIIPSMMASVKLRIGESYPIVSNSNTIKRRSKLITDAIWICNSSLDYFQENNMEEYVDEFDKKWLTNSPNPLQIQREQKLFLYFIVEENFGYGLKLRGNIKYWDGTNDYGIDFYNISSGLTNAGGVFLLNTSYDKLDLATYENNGGNIRKIKSIELRVTDFENNGITENKTLLFNINEQPRKFGIVFQNRLGTYDTFDFVGIREDEVNREYGEFTIPTLPADSGRYNNGFKVNTVYNTRVTNKITVNTGYLNATHLDWLRNDLLTSNDIYTYTTTNHNYLKLVDYKYKKSSLEDLFDMEVTFEYTTFINNISI